MLGLLIRDKLNLAHFCGAPFVLSSCGHCYKEGEHPKKKNIYIPAPPSGTDKCVLLGCLVHFFGKRADSENNLIFEHIF